jgi:hypothetical protein
MDEHAPAARAEIEDASARVPRCTPFLPAPRLERPEVVVAAAGEEDAVVALDDLDRVAPAAVDRVEQMPERVCAPRRLDGRQYRSAMAGWRP